MEISFISANKNNYQVGRKSVQNGLLHPVTKIVMHTMGGTFQGTTAWFQNPSAKASAHYLVGFKGQTLQMVKESDVAYHATNYTMNLDSIGIEHEDMRDPSIVRPSELYEASSQLVADICRRYKITCNRSNILLHREIYSAKSCPGTLDVDRIIRRANEMLGNATLPLIDLVVISETGANVRSSPSVNAQKITAYPYGAIIQGVEIVVGDVIGSNNKWWKLSTGSFVFSGIVSPKSQQKTVDTASVAKNTTEENQSVSLQKGDENNQLNNSNLLNNALKDLTLAKERIAVLETENQLLLQKNETYQNFQSVNKVLSDEIEAYKKKVIELSNAIGSAKLQAFSGWSFIQVPAGGSKLTKLPPILSQIQAVLQNSLDKQVVVGYKVGGKIVAVNTAAAKSSADTSILNG